MSVTTFSHFHQALLPAGTLPLRVRSIYNYAPKANVKQANHSRILFFCETLLAQRINYTFSSQQVVCNALTIDSSVISKPNLYQSTLENPQLAITLVQGSSNRPAAAHPIFESEHIFPDPTRKLR